ncbi:hypothetical protein Tco_1273773 [Tanacetum coccineum]
MPPRRFKKKSVKRIVKKRVAKAIEEYEKTRADSNNTGGSGQQNTGGNSGLEGVVGLKRWFRIRLVEQVFRFANVAEADKVKFAMSHKRKGRPQGTTISTAKSTTRNLLRFMWQPPTKGNATLGTLPWCNRCPSNSIRQNVTCFGLWIMWGTTRVICPELKPTETKETKLKAYFDIKWICVFTHISISDDTCDVPVCEDSSTFDALSNHSKILSDSNDDDTSSDEDSYENIEYIEASPLNLEYDSLEEVNEDQEEKEFDLEDIFQIQDVILCEKLLNISRLITNIEYLKDNPIPNHVLKSPSSVPISVTYSGSFFEESDTFLSYLDNSLPELENFSDHTEETRSGSTTTHANNSLLEFESFYFDLYDDC